MKRIFQASGSVPVPGIAPGQGLRRRLLEHLVEVLKADRAKNFRASDSAVEFTSGVESISGPFPKSPLGFADEGSIRVEETSGMMCVSYHLVYWRSLRPLVLVALLGFPVIFSPALMEGLLIGCSLMAMGITFMGLWVFLGVQVFQLRVDRFLQTTVSEWRRKTFPDPAEQVSTANDQPR